MEEKPTGVVKKLIHGNPWNRDQITGSLNVGKEDPNQTPSTLPDGTPLLTQTELMEKQFEDAGCPTKGSQPQSDFKPDH